MNELLAVAGRLHPLLLHLPIGFVAGLAALETLGALRRSPPPLAVMATLTRLTQLAAAAAITTGLLLEQEGGYPEALADQHRNVALAFFVVSLAMGRFVRSEARRTAFRVSLGLALVLIGVAGHLGASITHGGNFLFEPLEQKAPSKPRDDAPEAPPAEPREAAQPQTAVATNVVEQVPAGAARSTFEERIAPLFAANCTNCHGEDKRKGRLAMHTREGLERGGSSGAAFVAGDVAASLLVQRLELPLDDEEHMPPADKPQPSAQDVALIKAWIAAGAPFEGQVELRVESVVTPAASTTPIAPKVTATSAPFTAQLAPPPAALDALRRELAHVQPVSQTDPLLWIDFAAPAAEMDDARVRALLEPLVDHVAELSLARTKIGDATLELIARMPQLRKLDLRATLVTDAGARWLAAAPRLRELVAAQTSLGDEALADLAKSTSLERLVLWNSAATEAGITALQAARPALAIDSGALPNAAVLEAESEVKFTSDAPLPGAEAVPAALTPLNARCPVSDAPVNPKYAVVFEGKVVGFCCPNCPKEFWADPKAFAEKLK